MPMKFAKSPLTIRQILTMAYYRSLDKLEVEQRRMRESAKNHNGTPGRIVQAHYDRAKKLSDQLWKLYQLTKQTDNLQIIFNHCQVRDIELQLMVDYEKGDDLKGEEL